METHGWKLPADADIFGLAENVKSAVKKPLRDFNHGAVLAQAVNYRDMDLYGNAYTKFLVLEAAENLHPPVYLNKEYSYLTVAMREVRDSLMQASFNGYNMTISIQRVSTGEYILLVEGPEVALKATAGILGEAYVCYGDMIGVQHASDENTAHMKEFWKLSYKMSSVFSTSVLNASERQFSVTYFLHNPISGPSRESRAKYLTNAMLEDEKMEQGYDALYPEVLAKLPEFDAYTLVSALRARQEERI